MVKPEKFGHFSLVYHFTVPSVKAIIKVDKFPAYDLPDIYRNSSNRFIVSKLHF